MANEEQLSILKQGATVWNRWVEAKPLDVSLDLSSADLRGADLRYFELPEANLASADLSHADLTHTWLEGANLKSANLSDANFSNATLRHAELVRTTLNNTNFRNANLWNADLSTPFMQSNNFEEADLGTALLYGGVLTGSSLNKAHLYRTIFDRIQFTGCILGGARTEYTIFASSDLSQAAGLTDVVHTAPSIVSHSTLAVSRGKIPEIFLRGCGLSDADIEYAKLYNPDLDNEQINKILYRIYDLRASQAIQVSPLFISYSYGDGSFVDKIEKQLNAKGVRFWRDIHDMKSGRIETQIDRAIRQNPTVLLVLSENSLASDWVEHEVRTARGLEKDMGRDVLCPIALDDSWKSSPWPKRVMEQIMEYNILDFSAWEDDVKFEGMFRKLIDGLELFYKG